MRPAAPSCARARMIMLVVAATLAGAAACGESSNRSTDMRLWTDDLAVRVSVTPMPPRALEDAVYRVAVRDRKTGQPIETGEGRIFATSRDGANTDDGLAKLDEPGAYSARLFYPTSGDWAIALQFRRDSTRRLERMDWIQGVRPAAEP